MIVRVTKAARVWKVMMVAMVSWSPPNFRAKIYDDTAVGTAMKMTTMVVAIVDKPKAFASPKATAGFRPN